MQKYSDDTPWAVPPTRCPQTLSPNQQSMDPPLKLLIWYKIKHDITASKFVLFLVITNEALTEKHIRRHIHW